MKKIFAVIFILIAFISCAPAYSGVEAPEKFEVTLENTTYSGELTRKYTYKEGYKYSFEDNSETFVGDRSRLYWKLSSKENGKYKVEFKYSNKGTTYFNDKYIDYEYISSGVYLNRAEKYIIIVYQNIIEVVPYL